ncbi:MAG: ammonia-forming cytochrome c nitrite reductase subunit c552 [Deltaproteobacteria bacterium]|nr:ammonia-forming cytochrome c nitrite reductase subunit c552 [Deltaproteobacteria bacterium]
MSKRVYMVSVVAVAIALVSIIYFTTADAQKAATKKKPMIPKAASKETLFDVKPCYGCHDEIKDFHAAGKHRKVNCMSCHEGLEKHLKDVESKPATRMDHATCGKCHKEQYESFISVNLESKPKVEKSTATSRSPLFDIIMRPHGFTREHGEPRSHVFSLVDQLLVDRAFGGRFQLKDWTKMSDAKAAEKSVWEILKDVDPSSSDQKIFPPYTPRTAATAANPVCLSCKTQDHIMKWAYMGDKNPKAKWDRTSKVVEMARDVHRPFNCYTCHDPHSAGPRVVRDALINAVVDRGEGTYPYDKEKSKKITMTKVMFRDFRAIGALNKPDSNLMCAQCHVEYNCNPVIDLKTGETIGMEDRRTNEFQWRNVFDYDAWVEKQGYRDFRNEVTGSLLSKIQHPEVEAFWGSKHERAGVECKDCHMPKMKKAGKTFTWHGQKGAKYMKKDTCLKCHPHWTEKEAEYQIEGVQNYIRGKMRKAELWLSEFVRSYQLAKSVGVSEDTLKESRKFHTKAHTKWEWWTAENSDGFHNPDQAKASLLESIQTSIDGVKFLEKAIEDKLKAGK